MWSASTSPFIHPKCTHYILVFILPYLFIHGRCGNFNGGGEMQCVTTGGFKRRGHGWWHMVYDVHGHMTWDPSSSIPSLASYPYIHLQKGCVIGQWGCIWIMYGLGHEHHRPSNIQDLIRFTYKWDLHPKLLIHFFGWKPLQVGSCKRLLCTFVFVGSLPTVEGSLF